MTFILLVTERERKTTREERGTRLIFERAGESASELWHWLLTTIVVERLESFDGKHDSQSSSE